MRAITMPNTRRRGLPALSALTGAAAALALFHSQSGSADDAEDFRKLHACYNQLACLNYLSRDHELVGRFNRSNGHLDPLTRSFGVDREECGPNQSPARTRQIPRVRPNGVGGRDGILTVEPDGQARFVDLHAEQRQGFLITSTGASRGIPPELPEGEEDERIVRIHPVSVGEPPYYAVVHFSPSANGRYHYNILRTLTELPSGVRAATVPAIRVETTTSSAAKAALRDENERLTRILGSVVHDLHDDQFDPSRPVSERGYTVYLPGAETSTAAFTAWRAEWTEERRRNLCGAISGALDTCRPLGLSAIATAEETMNTSGCLAGATSGSATAPGAEVNPAN